jgi:hypothetical protein
MIGLTITGNPIATLAVGASSSIKEHTPYQADIDAGKVVNTLLSTKDPKGRNRCIRNGSEQQYSTTTPLTQNPSIALVKTAAVGGTGKVECDYLYFATNTGNTTLTNGSNGSNDWINNHWKPTTLAVLLARLSKEHTP